jgi:thiol-disulfide isomerase/thioredoxin
MGRSVRAMKKRAWVCGLGLLVLSGALRAADPAPSLNEPVASAREAAVTALEQRVSALVQAPKITVVHFWAPWCGNCKSELANEGWKNFIAANPEVEFVFITAWSDDKGDGRALLASYGLGPQKNFQLHLHPNTSRRAADKMTTFLGLPVTWVPTTWVFREGKLRYALNYGEVRFPMLQQLIADSSDKW